MHTFTFTAIANQVIINTIFTHALQCYKDGAETRGCCTALLHGKGQVHVLMHYWFI